MIECDIRCGACGHTGKAEFWARVHQCSLLRCCPVCGSVDNQRLKTVCANPRSDCEHCDHSTTDR